MIVLLKVDLDESRPHKAVRVYDKNGNALGYGREITKDNRKEIEASLGNMQLDFFAAVPNKEIHYVFNLEDAKLDKAKKLL